MKSSPHKKIGGIIIGPWSTLNFHLPVREWVKLTFFFCFKVFKFACLYQVKFKFFIENFFGE